MKYRYGPYAVGFDNNIDYGYSNNNNILPRYTIKTVSPYNIIRVRSHLGGDKEK